MKVTIGNYNCDRPTNFELEKVGYRHLQEIEIDNPLKIVRKIYKKTDLNIMLIKSRNDADHAIIWVTMYRNFSQR